VGVDVDEAGCDDVPVGIDHLGGVAPHIADLGDPPTSHGHVTLPRVSARPVDDRAAPNQEIELLSHAYLVRSLLAPDHAQSRAGAISRRFGPYRSPPSGAGRARWL
jgi:hypothetical protein